MTKQADFKRRVRARMGKTGESYAVARAHLLSSRPDQPQGRPPAELLHVTNGDATVPGLRGTGLVDAIIAWRDVLHEGPVPDVPDDELRAVRAAFLEGENAADIGTASEFARRDRTLAAHAEGRYLLWFEADLYDQLQLIQILAKLLELEVAPEQITLVCIGEYPGIAHFGGLGQLTSEQLRGLPATAATTISRAGLEHATGAWAALRAPDPSGLGPIARAPSPELRFLGEAFDRLSREYPSTRDGLSLTERRILASIAEGAGTAGAAFARTGAREPRPFLGDTWCFDKIATIGCGAGASARGRAGHGPGESAHSPALDRRRPAGARRAGGPRRAQRRRSLDRRCPPRGPGGALALERGYGGDHRDALAGVP